MKLRAETRRLSRPLANGREGATVAVEPLKVGEADVPRAWLEGPGGVRLLAAAVTGSGFVTVPCPAYLIHHPSAGPFLVDTGLHPSVASKPAANMGGLIARFGRLRLGTGEDLPTQLRSRGIEAKAIRLVVMTHLHVDHASGMSEFPGATFVVSEREWEAASTASRPLLQGYRPSHFNYAFDFRTVDYDGPHVSSYSTFGRTFDLFGDGSVRLAFTPGHTAGHQAVICRLRDSDLVIAGDAIYNLRQLEDDSVLPPSPFDPHTFRRSLQELRLFRRQYPQARIMPGHDPEHPPAGERLE